MWRKAGVAAMWILSVVIGIGLAASGVERLRLTPGTVAQFEAFGYSLLFARLVGLVEVLGGLALLIPRLAIWSACGLSLLMLGAIGSHVVSDYGSPFHAVRTLALLLLIVGLRCWTRTPST